MNRSNTGAAANYYAQGASNGNASSTLQRKSHNMFAPYDYNKSLTTNNKPPGQGSVNTSQSFTPYGQSDRRGAAGHQIYNPINGTDASNSRGGRNTLQNNASLIMNQNGTASQSNINMASPGTTKSHSDQQHISDSFRQRHGNLYDRGSRATNNIVSGGGATSNSPAAHEYYQSSAPPGLVNDRTKPKVNLRG